MSQKPPLRHQRRRLDPASPQAEHGTTQPVDNSTTTAHAATSISFSRSSTRSILHSSRSSTSIGPPLSSSLTTFPRTSSLTFSSPAASSTRGVVTPESASLNSSSFSSSSPSNPLITTPASSVISISVSSSAHRLPPSSSFVSILSTATSLITSDPTPQTTLVIASALSTSNLPLPSTHGNLSSTSATSPPSAHDFWANKGAVAGTFTAVGLVIIGVAVVLAFFLRRRSRDSESYKSFAVQSPMGQLASGKVTPLEVGRLSASPDDLATHDPINPHASNKAYPEHTPYYVPPQGFVSVQERESDQLLSPSNPAFKRPSIKRGSYQPSVDSFYGASGA
ncbi:hypothetical protein E4T56_gene18755 [Termitomyces sp. T112]|nr:hypothetical protein E4T56_gene18755 [Termitomyces sp. T112]